MATGRMEHTGAAPSTNLAGSMLATDTTFTVAAGTGYPTGAIGKFLIAIDPGLATEEKILCSARSGATFTVSGGVAGRGYDNTTASAHTAPTAVVEHVAGGFELDDYNDHIYTTTRDDHTQYARTDGTRAITGAATFNSTVSTTALIGTLTGTNGRYVGRTAGAPTSGTFLTGDFADDSTNSTIWICTAGGTPGTWSNVGGVASMAATMYLAGSQTLSTSGGNTVIKYDTIPAGGDPGSHLTTGANALYTCSLPGRYLVIMQVEAASTNNTLQPLIYKNGSIYQYGPYSPAGTAVTQHSMNVARVPCVLNDTLQGFANTLGTGTTALQNGQQVTTFSVDYLGPT